MNRQRNHRTNRRWTAEEDERIIRQVRAFPQNLSRCFLILAEELDRSASAVSAHWYGKLSKETDTTCFFTASEKHVSKNRKNGTGVETNQSVWQRLMRVLRGII